MGCSLRNKEIFVIVMHKKLFYKTDVTRNKSANIRRITSQTARTASAIQTSLHGAKYTERTKVFEHCDIHVSNRVIYRLNIEL